MEKMKDHDLLLVKLGAAIDSALGIWTSWTTAIARFPTFESITQGEQKDTATTVKALECIVDTLPTRHRALVHAYKDAKVDFIELPATCANLLEELELAESGFDIGNELAKKLTSKRFKDSVLALEKQISAEEQGRI